MKKSAKSNSSSSPTDVGVRGRDDVAVELEIKVVDRQRARDQQGPQDNSEATTEKRSRRRRLPPASPRMRCFMLVYPFLSVAWLAQPRMPASMAKNGVPPLLAEQLGEGCCRESTNPFQATLRARVPISQGHVSHPFRSRDAEWVSELNSPSTGGGGEGRGPPQPPPPENGLRACGECVSPGSAQGRATAPVRQRSAEWTRRWSSGRAPPIDAESARSALAESPRPPVPSASPCGRQIWSAV